MIQEWEGQRLCSSRDPSKEGSQWAATQMIEGDHCWVLGLGAGFHVHSLAQNFPNTVISVIEHRASLKGHFEKEFPELSSQVSIEIVSNEEQLLASKSFSLFGASLSSVLNFRPALQSFENMYQGFSRSLRGQTQNSCLLLSEILNVGLSSAEISTFQQFHIKEVDRALQGSGNPEARAWVQVLMELVR